MEEISLKICQSKTFDVSLVSKCFELMIRLTGIFHFTDLMSS